MIMIRNEDPDYRLFSIRGTDAVNGVKPYDFATQIKYESIDPIKLMGLQVD